MISHIAEKRKKMKKKQQKVREEESEAEPEQDDEIYFGCVKKKKIEPSLRTKRTESYKHLDRACK